MLHVQKPAIGYVLAMGNGQVLYTYDKDTKGGAPACTGECAATWIPVAGKKPAVSPADTGLGTLGTVTNGSVTQITYNGLPLYIYKGAKALAAAGNGVGGQWHVVKLSASNIVGSEPAKGSSVPGGSLHGPGTLCTGSPGQERLARRPRAIPGNWRSYA